MTDQERDKAIRTRIKSALGLQQNILTGKRISVEDMTFVPAVSKIASLEGLSDTVISNLMRLIRDHLAAIKRASNGMDVVLEAYQTQDGSDIAAAAGAILDTLKKNYALSERHDPTEDMVLLEQQRTGVYQTYASLFSKTTNLRPDTKPDFIRILDFTSLLNELDASIWVSSLCKCLKEENGYTRFVKLFTMFDELDATLRDNANGTNAFFKRAIMHLQDGLSIPNADKVDFESAEVTILGESIRPYLFERLNNGWYSSNISTAIGDMRDNFREALTEPRAFISMNGEVEGGTANLIRTITNENCNTAFSNFRRVTRDLMERINVTAKLYDGFAQRLVESPNRKTDSYFEWAKQDLCRLLEIELGTLAELARFLSDAAAAIQASVKSIDCLAIALRNHEQTVEQYIITRGNNP